MKLIRKKIVEKVDLSLYKTDIIETGKVIIGFTALGVALLTKPEIHEIKEKEYSPSISYEVDMNTYTIEDALVDQCESIVDDFDSSERAYVKENIILEEVKNNIKKDKQAVYKKNILNEDTDLELNEQLMVLAESISKNSESYNLDNTIYTDGVSEYLGTYVVTSYCGCSSCCGSATGRTASGAIATPNHTLAADPSIPFGTKLMINGQEYVVEDRGGAIKGKHIDMFFSDHSTALKVGTRNLGIYLKNDEKEVAMIPTSDKTLVLKYQKKISKFTYL